MIGIIGAMQIETDVIVNVMHTTSREQIADTTFVRGTLNGVDAVVATCGPGKVFAAMCAEIMILRYEVESIINVGVAGTLTPGLHIGDIAIATATVQHDMDTSALGDPVGLISKINIVNIECDKNLMQSAIRAAETTGARAIAGVIATGDQFISDNSKKEIIVKRFGAIACEMEGGAIGHVCYVNRVPYLVLRAISDEADGTAPSNFAEFATNSAAKLASIMQAMLRQ